MFRDVRVVIRGGGELGSAAGRLLFLAGFPVAVLERAAPLAVRRGVSFADALRTGEARVEGVLGRRAMPVEAAADLAAGVVPVIVDPGGECLPLLSPAVVVDARMAKRNLGTSRTDAALVVGLGPGFTAGDDVHAVVETQRGPDLGRVIWSGSAQPDTAIPAEIAGAAADRVLRAPAAGVFRASARIGDLVGVGTTVGEVGGRPVRARASGLLRGLLADGVPVEAGFKLGDVDPRGPAVDPFRVSDKGRAVAAGVLEAVLQGRRRG
jgi:xanthine dehydrogenase accessory factor